MASTMTLFVNDGALVVPEGMSLAAALLNAGYAGVRRSVTGELRAPVCGMGSCFECRVTLDGVVGRRACLEPVRDGMRVTLDA